MQSWSHFAEIGIQTRSYNVFLTFPLHYLKKKQQQNHPCEIEMNHAVWQL